jgi:oligopeptide transport system permease protein
MTFLRRVLSMIFTLLLTSTLIFFLLRLAPGGPFDSDKNFPPAIKQNIEAKYGLDQPIHVQYFKWLNDLAHGDLRESFDFIGKPVLEIIQEALPVSTYLGIHTLWFSLAVGLTLGMIAAKNFGNRVDQLTSLVLASAVSLPIYLTASLLILFFSVYLNLLPPALWEGPSSAILPILALSIRPIALVGRLTRVTLIETLSQDYIRTAYAKGLPQAKVLFKHALKNAMIPLLGVLGPVIANLLTGSFLIETIFQIPGLGKYFVSAVLNRDYPLVMGVSLFYGVLLMGSNLIVDLLITYFDPRIRIESKTKI